MATASKDQVHPQYKGDREILTTLLQSSPNDYNLVELARLNIRYQGFPGARDIQQDLATILQQWQLTVEELYEKTREIHSTGKIYRKSAGGDEEDWT